MQAMVGCRTSHEHKTAPFYCKVMLTRRWWPTGITGARASSAGLTASTITIKGCRTTVTSALHRQVPTSTINEHDQFAVHHVQSHLDEVERTVQNVLQNYQRYDNQQSPSLAFASLSLAQRQIFLDRLPSQQERECWSIAHHLHERLTSMRKHGTCRRCWLQQPECCICSELSNDDDDDDVSLSSLPERVNRIFVLTHHKEIGMFVDTAKLIAMAFPQQTRLVVAGIPANYQACMQELQQHVLPKSSTLILFPDVERSKTWNEWYALDRQHPGTNAHGNPEKMDLVLLDGTWEQARRMYQRYCLRSSNDDGSSEEIPARRVRLSSESLASLIVEGSKEDSTNSTFHANHSTSFSTTATTATTNLLRVGQQLRRHPEPARQIATVHALQLLLQDILATEEEHQHQPHAGENKLQSLRRLEDFQSVANAAAQKQRARQKRTRRTTTEPP